jgi:thymidylate synthase (FAD)
MKIKLLSHTPMEHLEATIRTCTGTEDKASGNPEFFTKIARMGHTSVFEHIQLMFRLEGVSRAFLQECARHRIASLTVQSSRFALKKIASNIELHIPSGMPEELLAHIEETFKLIEKYSKTGVPNDVLKYAIHECLCTKLTWSINLRSFANMFHLRSSPRALQEFQDVAFEMFENLPMIMQEIVLESK